MEKIKQSCPGLSFKVLMNDTLLVDVREKNEFEQVKFDVPEMIHIPFSKLDNRYNEIPKDRKVIIASYTGKKGIEATKFLYSKGYINISNMEEGLSKWLHKKYPVLGDKYFDLR